MKIAIVKGVQSVSAQLVTCAAAALSLVSRALASRSERRPASPVDFIPRSRPASGRARGRLCGTTAQDPA